MTSEKQLRSNVENEGGRGKKNRYPLFPGDVPRHAGERGVVGHSIGTHLLLLIFLWLTRNLLSRDRGVRSRRATRPNRNCQPKSLRFALSLCLFLHWGPEIFIFTKISLIFYGIYYYLHNLLSQFSYRHTYHHHTYRRNYWKCYVGPLTTIWRSAMGPTLNPTAGVLEQRFLLS